jgi:uncharacterized Zn-binding protein involved in type VI secretion
MTALEAAQRGDQIGHTAAWTGLVTGLAAGLAIGLGVALLVTTGPLGAVAIAGIIGSGTSVALVGKSIGERKSGGAHGPITTGSSNTFLGRAARRAARAGDDSIDCFLHGAERLAQGSATVHVNGKMFARRTEKTTCSGVVRDGCPTVLVGGPTATDPDVKIKDEVPDWVVKTLQVISVGTAIFTGVGIWYNMGLFTWAGFWAGVGSYVGPLIGGGLGGWIGAKIGRAIGGETGAVVGAGIGATLGGLFVSNLGPIFSTRAGKGAGGDPDAPGSPGRGGRGGSPEPPTPPGAIPRDTPEPTPPRGPAEPTSGPPDGGDP